MLGKMFEDLRDLLTLRALKKQHPVYRVACLAIHENLADTASGLGKHASREYKEDFAAHLLLDITGVIAAPDPVMANRERLSSWVSRLARFQVLVLQSPKGDTTAWTNWLRSRPGITGELKAHLKEIAEKDKEIKQLAWRLDNPTSQQVYEACLLETWTALVAVQVFDAARRTLGDYHPSPDKDWLLPFGAAMCARSEQHYRETIGLPSVLSTERHDGSLVAIKYTSFLSMVMSGAKYPNFEWEEAWSKEDL